MSCLHLTQCEKAPALVPVLLLFLLLLLLMLFIYIARAHAFKIDRESMGRSEYRKLHHERQKGCPLLDLDGYCVFEQRACHSSSPTLEGQTHT